MSTLSALSALPVTATRLTLPFAVAALLLGCEAAPEDGSAASAPTASGLVFVDPDLVVGVTAPVSGSLDVADPDGDLATLHLAVSRPDGSAFGALEVPIGGAAGQTSGNLPFAFDFTPDTTGRFTLEVWVVDARGQSSNRLTTMTAEVESAGPKVKELSVSHEQLFAGKASTMTGTVEIEGDDAEAVVLRLVRPDQTAWPEVELTATGTTVVFTLDVTPDVVGDHVLEAWVVDADGVPSAKVTRAVEVFDTSNVSSACAALELDCAGQGICYDVTDSTCDYFVEHQLPPPEPCAAIDTTGTTAMCVSSTSDPESPLLTDENRCKFVQFWSYPTNLPIDCRCPEARFDQRCRRPYEAPQALSFGSGPRIRSLAGTFQPWRGIVVGREWFLPVMWSTFDHPDETMIFGIDLDSGDRRYVSGAYDDPSNGYTEVGTGDPFLQLMDLAQGPGDGFLYGVGAASDIAAPKLWRVDPDTGARTKIFDEDTADPSALCQNFSSLPGRKVVQMTTQGWALDGQGRFYFSNVGMPGPSILRLTVAGVGGATETRCEYLTRVMDCPTCTTQDDVGEGYSTIQFDFTAFTIKDDKLYAVSDKRFVSVELATGRRAMLSFASDIGALGTGPINGEGLADRWTTWDPHREVFWTVGILGGSMAVTVDPTTGNRAAWPCFHDTRGVLESCGGTGMALVPGPLNFGGMVIDPLPPHDLFFAHDLMSVVKYEVRSGNAYVFSL